MRPLPVALACLLLTAVLRAAPVPPQASGSSWVFALPGNGPRLEVNPAVGARLSSLKLGAGEFLYLDKGDINWGATFWTSPQSAWNWPPPEALDRGPFIGGPEGSSLVLAGAADGATGFAFTKRLSADNADTSFTLRLVLRNPSGLARQVAPWMVTRVLPGGLTVFPKGPGGGRGDLAPLVEELGGWMWFDHAAAQLPQGNPKYFGDGAEGWMAHVDKDGLLLLEVFPDIAASVAAPGEAEIEIYADPARRYMEIEHQGPYGTLAAGDSLPWTTRWYLRRLPAGIPRKAGDPKLVEYVTALVRLAFAPSALGKPSRTPAAGPRRGPSAPLFRVPGRAPVDAAGRTAPSPSPARRISKWLPQRG